MKRALRVAVVFLGVVVACSSALGGGTATAYWFNNMELAGEPELVREEEVINYLPTGDSPVPGIINADNISARWVGILYCPTSGECLFDSLTDDGVRLWVDGELVIDSWVFQGASHRQGGIDLRQGYHELRLEWFEGGGGLAQVLSWQPAGATSLALVTFALPSLPSITITEPNGGETWFIGSTVTIRWTWTGPVNNVRVVLHRNGVSGELAASVPNTGSYPWQVTGPAATDCQVVVTDVSYVEASDTSDNCFTIAAQATAQFVDINANLPGVAGWGGLAWGDYDNDGDLDLVLTGQDNTEGSIGKIFRNDGGMFTDIQAQIAAVTDGQAVWGDYDNDGDLDLAVFGESSRSRIYRNDAGAFVDLHAALPAVSLASVAWGDYDNDGDLDLAVTGGAGPGSSICDVLRNDGGGRFTAINSGMRGVWGGSVAWGDYDNDGDLDLLVVGSGTATIYRNDEGSFTDIGPGLTGVYFGCAAWGDYDGDGRLDLALAGWTGSQRICRIYQNDGDSFFDIDAGLTGVDVCSVAWGDCDNDGDLDLAVAGRTDTGRISKVYRNDNGQFVDINAGLVGVEACRVAWGDYDGDGDLDLVISGGWYDGAWHRHTKIYRNDCRTPNSPPEAPTDLEATVDGGLVELTWDGANDDHTPSACLTYNLRVGRTPGGCEVVSGMADPASGLRRIPAPGNTQNDLSRRLNLPPGKVYYWSVQTVDSAFVGSPWAEEQVFGGLMLTVMNGTGSGRYDSGAVVPIAAQTPAGYRFDKWTGDVGNVADAYAASTTVTMNADATVTAAFVRQYKLTVVNGTGSGTYDTGSVVPINAAVPAGYRFDKWTGDVGNVADVYAASTTVTVNAARP